MNRREFGNSPSSSSNMSLKYRCPECGDKFTTPLAVEIHYQKQHLTDKNRYVPCRIIKCDRQFETYQERTAHEWMAHSIKVKSRRNSETVQVPSLDMRSSSVVRACRIQGCHMKFPSMESQIQHESHIHGFRFDTPLGPAMQLEKDIFSIEDNTVLADVKGSVAEREEKDAVATVEDVNEQGTRGNVESRENNSQPPEIQSEYDLRERESTFQGQNNEPDRQNPPHFAPDESLVVTGTLMETDNNSFVDEDPQVLDHVMQSGSAEVWRDALDAMEDSDQNG